MGSSKFSPCVIIPLWLLTFDNPNWPPATMPLLHCCRQSPIYSLFEISLEKLLDNDRWRKTLEKCSKTCFPARPLLTSKSWSRKIFVAFQCKSSSTVDSDNTHHKFVLSQNYAMSPLCLRPWRETTGGYLIFHLIAPSSAHRRERESQAFKFLL